MMRPRNLLKCSPSLRLGIAIITVLAVGAILATGFVLTRDAPEPADIQDIPVGPLVVSVVRYLDNAENGDASVEAGGPCLPYHAVGPWATEGPYLIVTDLTDRIVGVRDIRQGMWESRDEGLGCVARVEVPIPDVPFYTFAIADVYKRTVLRSVLVDAGWHYEIVADVP